MARNKQRKSKPNIPGHFSKENWARWTNAQLLAWTTNFRDQMRKNDDKLAKKFDISPDRMSQMDVDVAALERVVEQEKAARLVARAGLEQEMNFSADELLGRIDNSRLKSLFIPPGLKIKKDGN